MAGVSSSDITEMDECIPETFELQTISKIQVGKVILKICGNEGTKDSEAMANMRRLLQSTIEYLETEKKEVWLNAEVTVFDDFGNTIIMVSGGGRHKFTVSNNGNNETEVVNTKRPGFFYRLKSHFCEGIQPLQAIEDVNDTVNQDVKDSVNPSSGLVACWQA